MHNWPPLRYGAGAGDTAAPAWRGRRRYSATARRKRCKHAARLARRSHQPRDVARPEREFAAPLVDPSRRCVGIVRSFHVRCRSCRGCTTGQMKDLRSDKPGLFIANVALHEECRCPALESLWRRHLGAVHARPANRPSYHAMPASEAAPWDDPRCRVRRTACMQL